MTVEGYQPREDVELVKLDLHHADAMFRWVSDPDIAENIGLRRKPSIELTREWIKRSESDSSTKAFAILLKNKHVGNVVLDQYDPGILSSRLSIYIGEPEARGCGVGKSAIYVAADFQFNVFHRRKLWLVVHTENAPAIATYKSIGFQIEGTHRQEFRMLGSYADVFYMGLLREEFPRVVKE